MKKKQTIYANMDDSKKKRIPYESPQITFTEIEVEEALMGFCKSGGGGMPGGCSLPCSNPGS